MKKSILLLIIILGSVVSYSQTKSIVGAWLWQDSITSFSLFIRENGTIEKHVGPINEPIMENTLKRGTYKFKDNQNLIIIWADKSTEVDKVKLIDKFRLQIQLKLPETNKSKIYTFRKVIDEEVELPPEN